MASMPEPLTLAEIAARAPRLGGRRVGKLLAMYLEPMLADEHAERRIAAGLTQSALARMLGTAQPAIAHRELGLKPVPREAALLLRQL